MIMKSAGPGTKPERRTTRPTLAGIEVREDDVDPATTLHVAGKVFRVAAVIILLLATWQAYDWFSDPPMGGAGLSVIIGDTIRLVVVAVLLYGAADLADLIFKNFEENRAARILLARQTYLMREWHDGSAGGGDASDRRDTDVERSVPPAPPTRGG
jgi:hypothetical protein